MASDLEQKIIHQVESYFGDVNLPYHKLLQKKIEQNEGGWVPMEVMLKFKGVARLSKDSRVIAGALEKSEKKLVLVSEDKTKMKRNPEKPLPPSKEEYLKKVQERTAFAKGFPLDAEMDDIMNFVMELAPIESVIEGTYPNQKFTGSCLIVFKNVKTAKKFVGLKSLKFKNIELVRIMYQDYERKMQKIDRKKQQHKETLEKQALINKQEQKIQFPNGAIVQFSGTSKGNNNWTMEGIKETLKQASGFEVVYIDFNQENTQGYAIFLKENNAADFVKKLTEGELEIGDNKLKVKALEGAEEKKYLEKNVEAMDYYRQQQ